MASWCWALMAMYCSTIGVVAEGAGISDAERLRGFVLVVGLGMKQTIKLLLDYLKFRELSPRHFHL